MPTPKKIRFDRQVSLPAVAHDDEDEGFAMRLCTLQQAADELGVTKRCIQLWIDQERVTEYWVELYDGTWLATLVDKDEVKEYFDAENRPRAGRPRGRYKKKKSAVEDG